MAVVWRPWHTLRGLLFRKRRSRQDRILICTRRTWCAAVKLKSGCASPASEPTPHSCARILTRQTLNLSRLHGRQPGSFWGGYSSHGWGPEMSAGSRPLCTHFAPHPIFYTTAATAVRQHPIFYTTAATADVSFKKKQFNLIFIKKSRLSRLSCKK